MVTAAVAGRIGVRAVGNKTDEQREEEAFLKFNV
jgi:hypothetical protein